MSTTFAIETFIAAAANVAAELEISALFVDFALIFMFFAFTSAFVIFALVKALLSYIPTAPLIEPAAAEYWLLVIFTSLTDSALISIFPPAFTLPPTISASVLLEKSTNLTPTPAAIPPNAILKLSNAKVSVNLPSLSTPCKTVFELRVISSLVAKLPFILAIAPVFSFEDAIALNLPSPFGFSPSDLSEVALLYCCCTALNASSILLFSLSLSLTASLLPK